MSIDKINNMLYVIRIIITMRYVFIITGSSNRQDNIYIYI
jgi:hypothetical protein